MPGHLLDWHSIRVREVLALVRAGVAAQECFPFPLSDFELAQVERLDPYRMHGLGASESVRPDVDLAARNEHQGNAQAGNAHFKRQGSAGMQ
jgi:hypothetical protein